MSDEKSAHHGRRIATSTLWQVASQATMAVLSIATVKLVAIGLSKDLAGNYNSAYSFLQIFGILADFGLYAVAVREVARSQHKEETMGALIILRFCITVLSLATAVAIAWAIPLWRGTPLPLGITIAAFVPFFTLLAGIQRTIFQVSYRMHFVFVAEVLQRVLALGIIAAVVAQGVRESYDVRVYGIFLLAGSIGALLLFLLSTFFAQRILRAQWRVRMEVVKKLMRRAAPYGVAFFCMALYRQLDVTFIALLRPDYELQNAYYGFAMRAVEMGFLFPTFLLNSTLPIVSERDERGEDTRVLNGKIFFVIALLGATLFLFGSLWARPLMELLTRPEYLTGPDVPAGADTALRLLSFPMLLNGIILFSFYSLLTRHAWRPLVSTLLLGAIFSISLNLMLIPSRGFVGAGFASIFTHCFIAAALLPQSLRFLPIRLTVRQCGAFLLYVLLLGGGLLFALPLLGSSLSTVLFLALAGFYVAFLAFVLGIWKELHR